MAALLPWMQTFQGAWHEAFPNREAALNHVPYYAHLNLSNLIGWGPGTTHPHPRQIEGAYVPSSNAFNLWGMTARQFLAEIGYRSGGRCRRFLYTTPSLDRLAGWNPSNGMPPVGTLWDQGGWGNFRNSLWAMHDQVGYQNYEGVFLDMCGHTYIDAEKLNEAVAIVKGHNKYCCLNMNYAALINAQLVCSPKLLGIGDLAFLEGLWFDSWNDYTREGSKAVVEYMRRQPYIRFAGAVEALGDTLSPPAYKDWIDAQCAVGLYSPFFRDGDRVEHANELYDRWSAIGGA